MKLYAPFCWFGGKFYHKDWIISHMPQHQTYVEPFLGAGSVFWAKPPSEYEYLSDINQDIITFYKVLQHKQYHLELQKKLAYTAYSREEFECSLEYLDTDDDIERARKFFLRTNQGFGGFATTKGAWGVSFIKVKPNNFREKIEMIPQWSKRIANATVQTGDAFELIKKYDTDRTLFYLDPPYVHESRTSDRQYEYEMDDTQHSSLVDICIKSKGMIMLSGYFNSVYEPLLDAGWSIECKSTVSRVPHFDGPRQSRVECLWINPQAYKCSNRFELL